MPHTEPKASQNPFSHPIFSRPLLLSSSVFARRPARLRSFLGSLHGCGLDNPVAPEPDPGQLPALEHLPDPARGHAQGPRGLVGG